MDYLEAMCAMTGYQPLNKDTWFYLTSFENVDTQDLKDLVIKLFNELKTNYKGLTELIMFLNWKIWYHYERGDERLARVYNDLWEEVDGWAMDNLKDEEIRYFLSVTD